MNTVHEKFLFFAASLLFFTSSVSFASGDCDGPLKVVSREAAFKSRLAELATQLRIQRSPLEGLGTDLASINASLKGLGFVPIRRSFTYLGGIPRLTVMELTYVKREMVRGIESVIFRVTAEGMAPEQIYVRKIELESFGGSHTGLDLERLKNGVQELKSSSDSWIKHLIKVRDSLIVPEVLNDPYVLEVAIGEDNQWGDIELHLSPSFTHLYHDILLHSVAGVSIVGRVVNENERVLADLDPERYLIVYHKGSGGQQNHWAVDRRSGKVHQLYLMSPSLWGKK